MVANGGKGIRAKGEPYRILLDQKAVIKNNVKKCITDPKGYRQAVN